MIDTRFDNNDFQTKALNLLADLAKYTVMAVRECFPDIDADIAENIGMINPRNITFVKKRDNFI